MRARSIFVIVGMAVFAIGFVVTINELPTGTDMLGTSEGSALADSTSIVLVLGFLASMAGLGLATIAPAVMFMRARRAKG